MIVLSFAAKCVFIDCQSDTGNEYVVNYEVHSHYACGTRQQFAGHCLSTPMQEMTPINYWCEHYGHRTKNYLLNVSEYREIAEIREPFTDASEDYESFVIRKCYYNTVS